MKETKVYPFLGSTGDVKVRPFLNSVKDAAANSDARSDLSWDITKTLEKPTQKRQAVFDPIVSDMEFMNIESVQMQELIVNFPKFR